MTIYMVGAEVGTFTPQSGNEGESASPDYGRNSMFTRCVMRGTDDTTYAETVAASIPDEFWFHADLGRRVSSTVATNYVFATSTTEVLRIRITYTTLQIQAWTGAWTNIGAALAVNFFDSHVETIDFHVQGNSGTGTVTIYVAGTERATVTGDLSAVTGIETFRLYGGNSNPAIAQMIIADEPTIGWRLATYYPSGNGANTAWTGDYTGIDEIAYSDADFIYSASADQVETSTITGPALTGYVVRGVGVYCRARRGASGPQNLQLALRVSGTDYFSGSKSLGLGYDSYGHIWEDNPDTAVDWLASQIAALQAGVKSIT